MLTRIARILTIACILATNSQLYASNVICVKRMNVGGQDPCDLPLAQFGRITDRDNPRENICVRKYEDSFCKYNKNEFYHALGLDGSSICVMNFKQEMIGNPCSSNPQQYGYAAEPW